jgi:antitoxin MazE
MPTVQKWGNSLGIRVPKAIADQVKLRNGTQVEFDTSGGLLTIRPKRRRRYTLTGLLGASKGRSAHRELDRDRPVGREIL